MSPLSGANSKVASEETPEHPQSQTYSQWAREAYNDQYEKWMPWIEDQYLKWFGKGDNKASYVTKDTLSKSKITGNEQVDQIQDDASNLIGNQISDKGVLKPVGDFASKEGINRYERNGKDETGSYGGESLQGVVDSGREGVSRVGSGVGQMTESAGLSIVGGASNMKKLLP